MLQQLLFFEAVLKGVSGLFLITFPLTTIKVFGLQAAASGFWPRMLGAALIGMAMASAIEAILPAQNGLGLGGSLAMNLVAILVLLSLLIMGHAAPSRRGRALIWLMLLALFLLCLVEVAYV
ncbi:MAG: hypothetical protein AAFR04_02310 [Pseudomonadota bacterium]